MVDDGEATWRPPPRIGMVKKFPEEDAVLIGLELFAECSRRRYLALSEGLKMEFAATHTSSRTRYRKLWKRLLVHVQTSMALAGALVKRDLIESGQGRGHTPPGSHQHPLRRRGVYPSRPHPPAPLRQRRIGGWPPPPHNFSNFET